MSHWPRSVAGQSAQKTFASPGEACQALFQAVQRDDEQELEAILGAGKEVTSSGDETQDALERERLIQQYQETHRLVREPDGTTVLYIGAKNWPFPIRVVSKKGRWYFDAKLGRQEILSRRVGENEATAIQVCQALAMAEKQRDTRAPSDDPINTPKVLSVLALGMPTTPLALAWNKSPSAGTTFES